MKTCITSLLALFMTISLSIVNAQQVELVKNINTNPTSSSHDPDPGVEWNDLYFYSGWSADGGREPWMTDGTEEGTMLLQDIQIGNGSSSPEEFSATSFGVFFRATGTTTGEELYFTDGTLQGTILVKDLVTGEENGGPSKVFEFNGLGYFSARSDDYPNGAIWTTDGTADGTNFLAVIDESENPGLVRAFEFDGVLYMTMYAGDTGQELYKTDGTPEGTALVKDIEPGSSSSGPMNYFVFNDQLYFTCWNSIIGNELWTSDGTEAGTHVVYNVNPGSSSALPNSFLIDNDWLYFSAQSTDGRNLWKTDGTELGTSQVSFIEGFQPNVSDLTSFNDEVYFVAEDDDEGALIWKSDGTIDGTEIVYNLLPDSDDDSVDELFVYNNDLYFRGEGSDNGNELWVVDGETMELEEWDLNPGPGDSFPFSFREFNGQLYFAAADDWGYELFVSDGTEEGTEMLINLNPEDGSFSQAIFVELGGNVIWKAELETDNEQLFSTDGTMENTSMITNYRGEAWSRIREMTIFDGYLFFNAEGNEFGQELWRSDGTPEGTNLYQDVNEGPSGGTFFRIRTVNDKLIFDSTFEGEKRLMVLDDADGIAVPLIDTWPGNDDIANIELHNGEVYFSARDTDDFGTGDDLWKTDGTLEGTVKVYDFGTYDISPEKFFSANDQLWFFGEQYGTSSEWGLYKSDGTSDGTEFVQYHNLNGNNWGAYMLEGYGDGVLYTVFNTSIGRELFYSDGTTEGSYQVQSIAPGSESPFIWDLVPYNGEMYFTADNVVNGSELWKTDGTGIGTTRITDILEGESDGIFDIRDGRPTLAEMNGLLIFGGANGEGDFELFTSDGTAEGTQMVLEINPFGSASPHNFFEASDNVYFTATDGIHGFELWRTDGTAEGTEMVGDINEGSGSSFPREYIEFEDHLYFQAYGKGTDLELYRFDQRCLIGSVAAPATPLCVGEELELSVEFETISGEIETIEWSLGDETSQSGESVLHTYINAGNYEVSALVSTNEGCEQLITTELMVNAVPVAGFETDLENDLQCLSTEFVPENTSTNTTAETTWEWSFGEEGTSEDIAPEFSFSETGEVLVSLIVSNNGCESVTETTITVYSPAVESVNATEVSCYGALDGMIEVSAISEFPITGYSVDGVTFQNDGNFEGLGAEEYTLYFEDENGCVGTAASTVETPDEIIISWEATDDSGAGDATLVVDVAGGIGDLEYDLEGNVNTSGEFENLSIGTYMLIVTDQNGCTAQTEVEIDLISNVNDNLVSHFQIYPNPASNYLTIVLNGSPSNGKLFDNSGRVVRNWNLISTKTEVPLMDLSPGTYTLIVDGYTPEKLIIIR